ncbi:MAG: hypothetical protein RR413_08290 [Christensenellaceae bacterium]
MHFTEKYNLTIRGHRDIAFIDMNLETDTTLYLDPTLIGGLPMSWCRRATLIIDDYFEQVFECCRCKDYQKLNSLVGFGKEPNETKLGLSIAQSCGKGSKPESLFKMFKSISEQCLIEKGVIQSANELCLFVKNFAEDRMSDLITNIMRKQLYEFTVEQCNLYGIAMDAKEQLIGRYWNPITHCWEKLIGIPLIIDGKKRLLVPKVIVRRKFIVSTAQYIQKQILSHRQAVHLESRSEMVHEKYSKKRGTYYDPPTKKEVFKKEIKGCNLKDYAYSYTEENPNVLQDFRRTQILEAEIWGYVLSDTQLDFFVYGHPKSKIA